MVKAIRMEILGQVKASHILGHYRGRWWAVYSHLHIIAAIDGEQGKYMFYACVGDLKEVPMLSQYMGAIKTKFF